VRQFSGHTAGVEAVAFDPNGERFVTGSIDRTVRVWEVSTGQLFVELKGHTGPVLAVAYAPNGTRVASVSQDRTAKLWDLETRKPLYSWPAASSQGTSNLRFSTDGKSLASVGPSFAIHLWSTEDGKETRRLTGPTREVFSLDYSPDGSRLVAVDASGQVWGWDPSTGTEQLRAKVHANEATCIRYSPNGKLLAIGGMDGSIAMCDSVTGQRIRTIAGHPRNLSELSFSTDGKTLATVGHEGSARLWDVEHGTLLPQSGGQIASIALSSDGVTIAATTGDRTISFWNTQTAKELPKAITHTQPVVKLAYLPEGELVTADGANAVRFWTTDGKSSRSVHTGAAASTRLVVSPGGQTVASIEGGMVELIRTPSERMKPEVFRSSVARFGPVRVLAFSAGERYAAAACSDGRLHVWDLTTGREAFATPAINPLAVGWSPDGYCVATLGADRTVRVWEAVSGQERCTAFRMPTTGWSVAFSPDGSIIAAGGEELVHLWDVRTGRELASRKGQLGPISYLAFTPDAQHLLSASVDILLPAAQGQFSVLVGSGTAITWDLAAPAKLRLAVPPATAADRDSLWAALRGSDPLQADNAIWRLAAAPAVSIPLLREKLPQTTVTRHDGRIAGLIEKLDDDDLDTRERATSELIKLGPPAGTAARQVLVVTKSREVRRRAEEIVAKVGTGSVASAEEVLVVRGVEVLQRTRTADANKLIESWANGPETGALKKAAQAAISRKK